MSTSSTVHSEEAHGMYYPKLSVKHCWIILLSLNPTNVSFPSSHNQSWFSGLDQTVTLSMFAYLYSEMVQYHQNRVDSISELERRLEATGYGVGLRVLELLAYRSREYKRETRLMNLLQFVSTTVWKSLFGKAADSLERSIDHADEFMIIDYTPITRYVTAENWNCA